LCPIKNSPLSFFLVSLSEREGVREREKMKDRRRRKKKKKKKRLVDYLLLGSKSKRFSSLFYEA